MSDNLISPKQIAGLVSLMERAGELESREKSNQMAIRKLKIENAAFRCLLRSLFEMKMHSLQHAAAMAHAEQIEDGIRDEVKSLIEQLGPKP